MGAERRGVLTVLDKRGGLRRSRIREWTLARFGLWNRHQGLEAIRTDRLVLERRGLAHPLQQNLPVSCRHLRGRIVALSPRAEFAVGFDEVQSSVCFYLHTADASFCHAWMLPHPPTVRLR